MIAALVLAVTQIVLSPCVIEGVPGPTHCGNYRVWEDRTLKRGRQITISITVLNALASPHKPDALFTLQGGPGDAPSFNARFYGRVFAEIRKTRDIVLVDLRGTGKSGALLCPELGLPDSSGILDADILSVAALRNCRTRLEKQTDLTQYTTEIAVDDLDEVRRALGYEQINLYGTSYGSRVAQVYMQRHPSALRTVTLKGVVPPSMASPENHARASEEAWQDLVKRCQADTQCAQNFPNLDADFRSLLDNLQKTPPVIAVPASDGRGETKLNLTRGLFAEAFRNFLYSPEASARAPALLKTLATGDQKLLGETSLNARLLLGGERLAAGFFLSVSCTEDVPFLPKNLAALTANTFAGDYRLRQQIDACRVWPSGKVSTKHGQLTRSTVPTLLISGEFDPVTPPSGGEEVLRGLSKGLHVVVKNNGHPIGTAAKCIESMMASFIEKGSTAALDTSCAATVSAVPFATSFR